MASIAFNRDKSGFTTFIDVLSINFFVHHGYVLNGPATYLRTLGVITGYSTIRTSENGLQQSI